MVIYHDRSVLNKSGISVIRTVYLLFTRSKRGEQGRVKLKMDQRQLEEANNFIFFSIVLGACAKFLHCSWDNLRESLKWTWTPCFEKGMKGWEKLCILPSFLCQLWRIECVRRAGLVKSSSGSNWAHQIWNNKACRQRERETGKGGFVRESNSVVFRAWKGRETMVDAEWLVTF